MGWFVTNYASYAKKAETLRRDRGPQAAAEYLGSKLPADPRDVVVKQMDGYVSCVQLRAICLEEAGDAFKGLATLSGVLKHFPAQLPALGPVMEGILDRVTAKPPAGAATQRLADDTLVLVRAYLTASKRDVVVRVAEMGLRCFPLNRELLEVTADALAALGRVAEALSYVKQVVLADPNAGAEEESRARVLLDVAKAKGDAQVAAEAQRLLGEILLAQQRFEEALPLLERAQADYGDEVAPLLLRVYKATGNVGGFAGCAEQLLSREDLPEDTVTTILADAIALLQRRPNVGVLHLVAAVCQFRKTQFANAVEHFNRAICDNAALRDDVLAWYENFAVRHRVVNATVLLGAAQAFAAGRDQVLLAEAASRDEKAFAMLLKMEKTGPSPDEVGAAVTLLRTLLASDADEVARRHCLARLLCRQGDLPAAIEEAEVLLGHPQGPAAISELCDHVLAETPLPPAEDTLRAAAMRLVSRCNLALGNLDKAFDTLDRLAVSPAFAPADVEACRRDLERVVERQADCVRARVILGTLLRLLHRPEEAVQQYAVAVRATTPAPLLVEAAASLEALLGEVGDRAVVTESLARARLYLNQLAEARPHVLNCAKKCRDRAPAVLAVLDAMAESGAVSAELRKLLVEAKIAFGGEASLADALRHAESLLATESAASFVEEQCKRLLRAAEADETKVGAHLLRCQVLLDGKRYQELASEGLALARRFAVWSAPALALLDRALAGTSGRDQAPLLLAMGTIHLRPGGDVKRAAESFERAAKADLSRVGQEVIDQCRRLADREKYPPAVFAAVRVAIGMGSGADLAPDLLAMLPCCAEPQLAEARDCARQVLRQSPDSGAAILAQARIDARLGSPRESLASYRILVDRAEKSLLAEVGSDLKALERQHPEVTDIALVRSDAKVAQQDPATAREILLTRISAFPQDASTCAERLAALARGPDATWRDWLALGSACHVAGRREDALRAIRRAIEGEGADLARVLEVFEEVRSAAPADPAVRALSASVRMRLSAPQELASSIAELADLLAPGAPALGQESIESLLTDCEHVLAGAPGCDEVARPATYYRARVLELLGQHEAAAEAWEDLLRQWPEEHCRAASEGERALAASGHPAYRLVLAAARVAEGSPLHACAILRETADKHPEYLDLAVNRCQAIASCTVGEPRREAMLLGAEMLGRLQRTPEGATICLEVLKEHPESFERIKQCLLDWLEQQPDEPQLYFALASAEVGRCPEGLGAACTVLEQWLARDFERAAPAVIDFLMALCAKWPDCRDLWVHVMSIRFRQGPASYPSVAADAQEMGRRFGLEGSRAVLDFLSGCLSVDSAQVPLWYVRSECEEALGELHAGFGSLGVVRRMAPAELPEVRRRAGRYDDPEAPDPFITTFLGDLAREAGDIEEAGARYAAALDLEGCDLETLRVGIGALLVQAPDHPQVLVAAARCAFLDGKAREAAFYYRQAAGVTAEDLETPLSRLCEAFPSAAEPWFVRGELRHRRGRAEEAGQDLEKALRAGGLAAEQCIEAHKYLANFYALAEDFPRAIHHVSLALQAAPGDDEAAGRLVALHLAARAAKVRQIEAQIAALGETDDQVFALAMALKDDGNYEEAVVRFQKAARSPASRPRALLELGKCHLALSQCNLAVVAFRRVLAECDDAETRKEVLYHLGQAYSRLLLFDKAAEAFEELCGLEVGFRDAARRLEEVSYRSARDTAFFVAEIPLDLRNALKKLATRPAGAGQEGRGQPHG